VNDPYSDRVRCDHPPDLDEGRLAEELRGAADDFGRHRVVTFVDESLRSGLEDEGFEVEGVMPGFYRGESDCVVMGWATNESRIQPADPEGAQLTDRVLKDKEGTPGLHAVVQTDEATLDDAADIAEILGETFDAYPTPSGDPEYVTRQIEEGTPFRLVRENGDIVACASADLVRMAQTAELTDCATRPSHRGKGLMQAILTDLMDDLRVAEYPTAFTLARASVPGINVAFQRLGFKYRGRMTRSCRIGTGMEDMNIWSRWL
jgi:putative beta-lysine N-acetyltransferase